MPAQNSTTCHEPASQNLVSVSKPRVHVADVRQAAYVQNPFPKDESDVSLAGFGPATGNASFQMKAISDIVRRFHLPEEQPL